MHHMGILHVAEDLRLATKLQQYLLQAKKERIYSFRPLICIMIAFYFVGNVAFTRLYADYFAPYVASKRSTIPRTSSPM